MTRRKLGCSLAAAVLLVILAGLSVQASSITVVHQVARAFSTAAIQVSRGDVVQFDNNDSFDHQIVIDSPAFSFESSEAPPGSVTSVTFSKSGTFEVHCEIHPRMHMTVKVK